MNICKLGDTIDLTFVVRAPTGTVADADSTPTCVVFEGTSDTSILSPTITKRGSATGVYRLRIALSTANGFEVGKSYSVVATVVSGGITDKSVLNTFFIDLVQRKAFAVVADGGNTATTFKTDLSESTTDHWKDCLVAMATGTLAGQVKKCTAYNGTTKFITFTNGFTGAPSAGDVGVVINQ